MHNRISTNYSVIQVQVLYFVVHCTSLPQVNILPLNHICYLIKCAYFLQGRQGKGIIYVIAAGNGGPQSNTAINPLLTNIYTIPISSVEYDTVVSYGQIGSNIFAVGYGGSSKDKLIVSTFGTVNSKLLSIHYGRAMIWSVQSLTLYLLRKGHDLVNSKFYSLSISEGP